MKLFGASSPHLRDSITVNKIMLAVIIALLPACAVGIAVFGWYAALILAVSVASAVMTEAVCQKILKRPVTINDLSAVVTGLLIGMNMPPTVPIYVPIVGSVFAIVIVKQLFGGIGCNFVNPALAARAFLVSAWGSKMIGAVWTLPQTLNGVDAVSSATVLEGLKTGVGELPSLLDAFVGTVGGCIGEVSAAALLLGGIFLIITKIIDWRIPMFYLGTVAVFMFAAGDPAQDISQLSYVAYQLCSGGLMLGAFFMATDYVTSPVTKKGKIIFAVGCGLLTSIIRLYGGYPEGVSYSILLMNLAVPLIERFTVGRVFGKRRAKNA